MTIALALEYIPRRMAALGHGTEYYISFRHLVIQGSEVIEIDAHNQFYILVEPAAGINITSDFGTYDLKADTNEQIYEHQGLITITNLLTGSIDIKFIQVIPKNKNSDGKV